jgi:hypothetical protein
MASNFPAMLYFTNVEGGADTQMKSPISTATFRPYALVVQDVSGGGNDGTINECGADPALVMGVAMSAAIDANSPYGYVNAATNLTKVPVVVLRPSMAVGLCVGAGTLVAADEGKEFGITKLANGNWSLDRAKVTVGTNTRVVITRAYVTQQIAICHFLALYLQGDAIAS